MIRRSGSNRRYERDRNFGRKSWGVGGPTVLSERAWVRRPTDAVSHAYAHIEEFGEPVETGGSKISSGDSLHGDRHGIVETITHDIARDYGGYGFRSTRHGKAYVANGDRGSARNTGRRRETGGGNPAARAVGSNASYRLAPAVSSSGPQLYAPSRKRCSFWKLNHSLILTSIYGKVAKCCFALGIGSGRRPSS
jgi:hypothetical protein